MARRTNSWNAYESGTTGPLAIGATSVAVDSAAGLVAPLYLVIDPDDPLKREWIRVNTINSNTLENLVRNQAGSVGDVLHEAGAKIRSVPTKQIFDDIFQDAEDDELALTQHQTDGGDPHSQAGYLKQGDTDALYVRLVGSTMSGALTLFADPTSNLHASTKQYVDASEVDGQTYTDAAVATHTALPSAHHAKYGSADLALEAVIIDFESRINNLETSGVPPTAHVHSGADITSGQVVALRIGPLDALKITTGTFSTSRIPNMDATKITSGILSTLRIPFLNASFINAGVFTVARIPDLAASKITPGTFQAGGYTFPGSSDVGIDGDLNVNGNVNLPNIPAGAGTGTVRVTLPGGLLTES